MSRYSQVDTQQSRSLVHPEFSGKKLHRKQQDVVTKRAVGYLSHIEALRSFTFKFGCSLMLQGQRRTKQDNEMLDCSWFMQKAAGSWRSFGALALLSERSRGRKLTMVFGHHPVDFGSSSDHCIRRWLHPRNPLSANGNLACQGHRVGEVLRMRSKQKREGEADMTFDQMTMLAQAISCRRRKNMNAECVACT